MERRTKQISIRVTPEELEHLKKCSGSFSETGFKNGRKNFSAFLREKLLAEINYKNKSLERRLKELDYELRKIGTNVNQIAKKINSGFGTPNDVAELKRYLARMENTFGEFQKEVEDIWRSQN